MGHEDKDNMLGPVRASIRTRLGEFTDVYMDAKIKIAQKLADKIAGENDIDNLMELHFKLNDVMISEDDIVKLNDKMKAFLDMLDTHASFCCY